jgi:HSP20 family molecular chaperone IbpA
MAVETTRKRWWPEILEDLPRDFRLFGGEHPIRLEESTEGSAYVVRAELPGIDPGKDVDITVQDGALTVHAERSERETTSHRTEFRYGSFTRAVPLPPGAREEDITASYDKGILTVTVPLEETGTKARRIEVDGG